MYFYRIKHTGNNLTVHDVCLQSSAQSAQAGYNVSVFPPSVTFLVDGNFHAGCRILLKPIATEENDMEKQGKYITDISRLNSSVHLFRIQNQSVCLKRSRINLMLTIIPTQRAFQLGLRGMSAIAKQGISKLSGERNKIS